MKYLKQYIVFGHSYHCTKWRNVNSYIRQTIWQTSISLTRKLSSQTLQQIHSLQPGCLSETHLLYRGENKTRRNEL